MTSPAQPRNGIGTAALVVGALSIPLLVLLGPGLVAGLGAIGLGVVGLRRARRGEATNGRVAVGGIALGAVGVLLFGALQAYGAYYTRGPAGSVYLQCVRDIDKGSSDANRQAEQTCADRLADQRQRSG